MRVTVLYSGRFLGDMTPELTQNQLRHLILPNNASVFVVADAQNWCHATVEAQAALATGRPDGFARASRVFTQQVRSAFHGWDDVHAVLLPEVHTLPSELCSKAQAFGRDEEWWKLPKHCRIWPHVERSVFMYQRGRANRAMAAENLPVKAEVRPQHAYLMIRWYLQMDHYARAEDFRRALGPHDVVVRTRLDALLDQPLHFSDPRFGLARQSRPASPDERSAVFAAAFRAVNADGYAHRSCRRDDPKGIGLGHCDLFFHDWLYFGAPHSMSALASVSRNELMHNSSMRCKGWCQEEQTRLQLQRAGVRLTPLPLEVKVHLARIDQERATACSRRRSFCRANRETPTARRQIAAAPPFVSLRARNPSKRTPTLTTLASSFDKITLTAANSFAFGGCRRRLGGHHQVQPRARATGGPAARSPRCALTPRRVPGALTSSGLDRWFRSMPFT
jgi:hypothetical protein